MLDSLMTPVFDMTTLDMCLTANQITSFYFCILTFGFFTRTSSHIPSSPYHSSDLEFQHWTDCHPELSISKLSTDPVHPSRCQPPP